MEASELDSLEGKRCFLPECFGSGECHSKAFTRLRGVQTIDGYSNPHPYTAEQEEAVSYLSKFGAGPNNVVDIDFTDRVRLSLLALMGRRLCLFPSKLPFLPAAH